MQLDAETSSLESHSSILSSSSSRVLSQVSITNRVLLLVIKAGRDCFMLSLKTTEVRKKYKE